jgi:hypothetical protein
LAASAGDFGLGNGATATLTPRLSDVLARATAPAPRLADPAGCATDDPARAFGDWIRQRGRRKNLFTFAAQHAQSDE